MRQSRRIIQVVAVLCMAIALWTIPVQAQTNLLQNGTFDGTYHGMGTAPNWEGWYTNSPQTQGWMNVNPNFYPHTGSLKRGGSASQNIGRDGGTFTAAVWQRVDNMPEGTALTASAWVYMQTGSGAGARVRIGIGPNTTDPVNPAITWGDFNTSINSWVQISVNAVVPAGSATVFIYATQNFPNGPTGPQQVYIEDATLFATGTGTVPTPGGGGGPVVPVATSTPRPIYAAEVGVQDTDPSDGITHTVQAGDTLAAIAVAYGTRTSVLRELNNLPQGSFLQVGQKIIISPPSAAAPTSQPAEPTTNSVAAVPTTSSQAAEPTKAEPTTSSQPAEPTKEAAVPTEKPAEPTTEPTTASNPPTAAPTNTPVPPSATSDVSPTPSTVPPSSTPAATVVVTAGAQGNPTSIEAGVCVLMFDDKNQNRLQSADELPLAGGSITLIDRTGAEIDKATTTNDGEPSCFVDIVPGSYSLAGVPPSGYGLTTPGTLTVSVQAGNHFQISFGAAEGVEMAAAPTPDNQVITDATDANGATATSNDPRSILGVVFIGLAAVVLVGGLALAVVIRRL